MSDIFGTLKVPETPVKSTEHGSEKCERTTSFELRTVWGEMIEDDDLYHPAYYTVSNVWTLFTPVDPEERLCDKSNDSHV